MRAGDVLGMAIEGDERAFMLWLLGLWLPACSGDGLWVKLGLGEAGRHALLRTVEVRLLAHGGQGDWLPVMSVVSAAKSSHKQIEQSWIEK